MMEILEALLGFLFFCWILQFALREGKKAIIKTIAEGRDLICEVKKEIKKAIQKIKDS